LKDNYDYIIKTCCKTKKKTLLMASTIKIAFNIDGQTIHSTLNTPIQ